MRRPFIAGNWKMNCTREESIALAKGLVEQLGSSGACDLAVCPPAVYLTTVLGELAGTNIAVGGQNCYHETSGAYTGETSPAMLRDVGCTYVILGHSERRHVLGESDEFINKKVHAALAAGLVPIVCLGELLSEREANQTHQVIEQQFAGSLASVTDEQMRSIVLAYEPVWAIGTGKVATPDQAEEVHLALRKLIADRYNQEIAESVRIQYGGSVKPDNAADLLAQPNIDGALVGGASLKAEQFAGIVAGLKS